MHDRELRRFRSLVESGLYLLTLHALDEIAEDDILAEEVLYAILAGAVSEMQIDRATGERKYVMNGPDHFGRMLGVVVKVGVSGKLVILTAYREEPP